MRGVSVGGSSIVEQIEKLIGGRHHFELDGTPGPPENPAVNSRTQHKAVPDEVWDISVPPMHANNAIKSTWHTWTEEMRLLYLKAQGELNASEVVVRKMTEEERRTIKAYQDGKAGLDDVFPSRVLIDGEWRNVEGNRAFKLGGKYTFKNEARDNLKGAYDFVLEVPLTGGLREYLLRNIVPDSWRGAATKMPEILKGLPRFKWEREGFTILIPKELWPVFSKYIK